MNFYQELIDELGIKNELTCFQCNNLVKNPMQCFNCQKISCKKCHKKKCCENPLLKKCLFLKNMIENLHKIKKPKEENSNNININYDDLINEINDKTNEIQNKNKKLTEIDENLKEKINDLQSKVDSFLKVKPTLSQAHRVRTVMQNYYLFKRGAYDIKDGKIQVNIDKVVPAANEMLAEIIRVQIDNDINKAEKYVNDNFIWTDEMQIIGDKLKRENRELNGKLENELADKLLSEE